MRTLSACPSCGSTARNLVAEYNGLIALPETRHRDVARYDYMLCHGCGLVYASRRPEGEAWQFLMQNFHEFLGRPDRERMFNYTGPLTPEFVDRMVALAPGFHEIGSILDTPPGASPDDKTRRTAAKTMRADMGSAYVVLDAIHRFAKPYGARSLEIRAFSGFISHWLRSVYQVREACVMTHLPLQTEVLRRAFGLNAQECLDFENFSIPFEGEFDLVLSNHMLLHAMDPGGLFTTIRDRMPERGLLIMYQELDDTVSYTKDRNLFGELRCFHFQQYDRPTLERVLRQHGFRPLFVRHVNPEGRKSVLIAGAIKDERVLRKPRTIPAAELEERRRMYRIWRDLSIVSMPDFISGLFDGEIREAERRLDADGFYERRDGQRVLKRPMTFLNEEGYRGANEAAPEEEAA